MVILGESLSPQAATSNTAMTIPAMLLISAPDLRSCRTRLWQMGRRGAGDTCATNGATGTTTGGVHNVTVIGVGHPRSPIETMEAPISAQHAATYRHGGPKNPTEPTAAKVTSGSKGTPRFPRRGTIHCALTRRNGRLLTSTSSRKALGFSRRAAGPEKRRKRPSGYRTYRTAASWSMLRGDWTYWTHWTAADERSLARLG